MKNKTKIIILISVCILIALIGIYFLFPKESNNGNIYVQKVSSVIGSSYTESRYSGVVESQETLDINQDGNKSITDIYVEAGQKYIRVIDYLLMIQRKLQIPSPKKIGY